MFPVAPPKLEMPQDYVPWLAQLKSNIAQTRLKVTLSSNTAMVLLYWDIGAQILNKQESQGWGAKIIDRLALDLHNAFPEMKGFSPRNLKYMRAFAKAWPQITIVQEALAQLPWYHNIALLEKLKSEEERLWYAHLRCYVVLEIKAREFQVGDGTQLGMYMTAVDKLLKHSDDKPTLGLLLVRGKNKVLVEYALGNTNQPMSVAEWETQLTQILPDNLRDSLPTIEQLEAELKK
jgi:predicted nuclease of restriction endonuclease-like (RecB) superfamily